MDNTCEGCEALFHTIESGRFIIRCGNTARKRVIEGAYSNQRQSGEERMTQYVKEHKFPYWCPLHK